MKKTELKRNALEDHLETTYLVRENVAKRDLAFINKPSNYPNFSKPDRPNNKAVNRAKVDLKLLYFLLVNMKPLYRNKILSSNEFQNVIQSSLNIGVSKFNQFTQEEKDNQIAFTVQMMGYCLEVMSKNMPSEFLKPLLYHIEPLNDLLESIYASMEKSGSKDLPAFRKIEFPIK